MHIQAQKVNTNRNRIYDRPRDIKTHTVVYEITIRTNNKKIYK